MGQYFYGLVVLCAFIFNTKFKHISSTKAKRAK